MSRSHQPPVQKGINPIWRGAGCLLMFVFTIGGYYLTGWLIDTFGSRLPFRIPTYEFPLGPWRVPISGVVIERFPFRIDPAQLILTVVVMIVMFSLMTVVWGMMNPVKPGPMDAPVSNRKVDHSKNR